MPSLLKQGFILLSIMGVAVAAHAGNIVFTISGTLSLDSGTDDSGLDGATFTYTATFLDTDTYYGWGGVGVDWYSITDAVSGTSSVTISGSTGNDSTYSTEDAIFAPKFNFSGGSIVYPSASYIFQSTAGTPPTSLSITLNDTSTLEFQLQMTSSVSAGEVGLGSTVESSQFLGTTPVFYSDDAVSDPTNLIQVNGSFYSLTGGVAAVPEGKYVSLALGFICLGYVGYRRYRRNVAA